MASLTGQRRRLTAGVVAATLTPMHSNGAPHLALLFEHCRRLIDLGCSSIVLLGTTGEANSFDADERRRILEGLLAHGAAAERLIVGTGCCAIADTIALSRHALSVGVTRLLVLPPFYYKKVSDEGLLAAYDRTIEGLDDDRARIYLYNIPQMSGVEIPVSLVERLREKFGPVIAGLKDSATDWPKTLALCSLGGRFDVLVGTETRLARALAAGASGCVSATANVNAAAIVSLFDRARAGDVPTYLEARINATRAAFEKYGMIPALKAYLAHASANDAWRNLRPPLTPLGIKETQDLAAEVARRSREL